MLLGWFHFDLRQQIIQLPCDHSEEISRSCCCLRRLKTLKVNELQSSSNSQFAWCSNVSRKSVQERTHGLLTAECLMYYLL